MAEPTPPAAAPAPAGEGLAPLRRRGPAAPAPLRALSLTGGGFRGLFSAQVLAELARLTRHEGPLTGAFDLFAGTSIGGLMACALAVGVPPARVLEALARRGQTVFASKLAGSARRRLFGALYDPEHLGAAVDEVLGAWSRRKLSALAVPLLVPAVDFRRSQLTLFLSAGFGKARASDATLRDACLATAAAPTYFPSHLVNGGPLLDGGLAANNPDALLLLQALRRWPDALARLELLSIGTAGVLERDPEEPADRSGLQWAPAIADFMITVQERSAAAQAADLLGARYLRICPPPAAGAALPLDQADAGARDALLRQGRQTAAEQHARHRAFVERMFAPRPR